MVVGNGSTVGWFSGCDNHSINRICHCELEIMSTLNPWTASDAAIMRAGQAHDDRLLNAYLGGIDDSEQPQPEYKITAEPREFVQFRLCDMLRENVTLTEAGHVDIPAFLRGM